MVLFCGILLHTKNPAGGKESKLHNRAENQGLPADIRYQNSITYLLGHLAGEIRRLRIERSQIHPVNSDSSRGENENQKNHIRRDPEPDPNDDLDL